MTGDGRAGKPELRVLQVFDTLGMGGAETWLIAVLRHYREAAERLPVAVRTDILLTGDRPGTFDREAESLGARLFRVRYGRRRLVRFGREFRAVLRRGRYHAVHDHQDVAAGIHFLLGVGRLPPVRAAHVHNPVMPSLGNGAPDRARRLAAVAGKRLLARLGTHVVATSRQVLTEYGFGRPEFAHLTRGAIHCGFDPARFVGDATAHRAAVRAEFGLPPDSRVVLFVGRLDTVFDGGLNQKNPAFALEVGRACVARDRRVRLLMAGSGDELRRNLEVQVRGWGLADALRLIGERSDIPRLMLAADLLLFPSTAEGLGMVAVEAQAAGLPVLASDAVPREASVVPGMVTFLSLTDGPDRWAAEVVRLLDLPRPDAAESNEAVARSAFSIANSADRLLRMYRGLPLDPPGVDG